MEYTFQVVYDAPCHFSKQLLRKRFRLERDIVVRKHLESRAPWSAFTRAGYHGVIVTTQELPRSHFVIALTCTEPVYRFYD